jgi:hypothetical protein
MANINTTATARKAKAPSNVVYLADIARSETTRPRSSAKKITKYHYPKSLLIQEYFCNYGAMRDKWHDLEFSLGTLGDENFVSPMGALLDQLEREGHNVKGARCEWLAFRDLAKYYTDLFFNLHIGHKSVVAAHLYKSSDN